MDTNNLKLSALVWNKVPPHDTWLRILPDLGFDDIEAALELSVVAVRLDAAELAPDADGRRPLRRIREAFLSFGPVTNQACAFWLEQIAANGEQQLLTPIVWVMPLAPDEDRPAIGFSLGEARARLSFLLPWTDAQPHKLMRLGDDAFVAGLPGRAVCLDREHGFRYTLEDFPVAPA